MKNLTEGDVIALIVPLAKSISLKYESIGITSITEGPGANQITFTLVNGQTHTVGFSLSASGISFTPPTGMISTDVQRAIEEILAEINTKSTVSVSSTGTATTEGKYITVNGSEWKISGGVPIRRLGGN